MKAFISFKDARTTVDYSRRVQPFEATAVEALCSTTRRCLHAASEVEFMAFHVRSDGNLSCRRSSAGGRNLNQNNAIRGGLSKACHPLELPPCSSTSH